MFTINCCDFLSIDNKLASVKSKRTIHNIHLAIKFLSHI